LHARDEEEESVNPLSPALGSRVYRERERREMERERKEIREQGRKEKVAMTKIVREDDGRVELRHKKESPIENSVLVKTRLERREEDVGTTSQVLS